MHAPVSTWHLAAPSPTELQAWLAGFDEVLSGKPSAAFRTINEGDSPTSVTAAEASPAARAAAPIGMAETLVM